MEESEEEQQPQPLQEVQSSNNDLSIISRQLQEITQNLQGKFNNL